MALPWLEAMAPATAGAGPIAGSPIPRRMAFFYVPNGVHLPDWFPHETGPNYAMPATLQPLSPFKDEMLVLTGLAQQNAEAMGDGPGDHARSLASFLTGTPPQDRRSRHPGWRLGRSGGGAEGWQANQAAVARAWNRCAEPSRAIATPAIAALIHRTFPGGRPTCRWPRKSIRGWSSIACFLPRHTRSRRPNRSRRDLYRKSILDLVLDDARQLRNRLGVNDQRKIDEYLTAVREMETPIGHTETAAKSLPPNAAPRPQGVPDDIGEHIRLLFDLIALAFQCDVTRICTFMYANEASNRSYPSINVPDGHHDLSHHGGDPKKHEKLKILNRFHIEQFAYLLGKLKSIKEGSGSVLDNSMIVYGSGISDGDRHNHDNLPILLCGKGGGTIKSGRHLKVTPQPLNNLYLSMLDRMGAPIDRLGDSTGRLAKLDG